MRERGFVARTVGIKIRFADFRTITRVRTLADWTDSTATIYDTAAELYDALGPRPAADPPGRGEVREPREADSVGEQLSFDDLLAADDGHPVAATPARRGATDAVVDAARRRFGAGAVGFGDAAARSGASVPDADQLPVRDDRRRP